MSFDLTDNNFFILGISPRDRADILVDTIEILLSDGELNEEQASKIQRELSGSKTRLSSEVSWLLEASPSRASQIASQFFDNTDVSSSEILKVIDEVGHLSSVNIAAYFCSLKSGDLEIVQSLISSWNDVSVEYVRNSVNENRQISSYPSVSDDLVKAAIFELKQTHAETALECIVGYEHPGLALSKIVEGQLNTNSSICPFLELIIEKYEGYVIPKLKAYEEDISIAFTEIKNLQSSYAYKTSMDRILSTLKNWDDFSQPLQLVHQSKGLDEPRAKRVFEEVRDISLWLANEKSEYSLSLEFTKMMTEIFPELPSSIGRLEMDIEKLTDLVEESRANEDILPIMKFLEMMLEDAQPLNDSIARGEFAAEKKGVAGDLYKTIVTVRQNIQGKPHEEDMWELLRKIGLFLYNKHNWIKSAITLNKGLITLAPPVIASQIRDDIQTLERKIIAEKLENAAKNNQIAKARDLAKQLVDTAIDANDKKEWEDLHAILVGKRNSQLRQTIIWGTIIGGFILFCIISDINKSPSTYQTSTSSNNNNQNKRHYSNSVSPTTAEIKPVVGIKVLSIEGLRWCTFERERLDFITNNFPQDQNENDHIRNFNGSLLSQWVMDAFDARINDYNLRCSGVNYYENDMSTVALELSVGRGKRVNEAKQIMRNWNSGFRFKE